MNTWRCSFCYVFQPVTGEIITDTVHRYNHNSLFHNEKNRFFNPADYLVNIDPYYPIQKVRIMRFENFDFSEKRKTLDY